MLRTLSSRSLAALRQFKLPSTALKTFSTSNASFVTATIPTLNKDEVEVTFNLPNGRKINAKGKVGDSLLDIVVNSNIDLDGFGACEGTLTCSTCHLILSKEDFNRLPEKPTDEELDMLDLAYELTETSRLGCQIIMTKELDGLQVKVPEGVNDQRSA